MSADLQRRASFPAGSAIVYAVGTGNRAKLESVYLAACQMFPENQNIIYSFSVESGVSDQPMSAVETQTGAVNRATATMDKAREAEAQQSGFFVYKNSANRKFGFAPPSTATGTAEQKTAVCQEEDTYSMAHFAIGLEGGVEVVGDQCFECGWMAVAEHPSNPYLKVTGNADANIKGKYKYTMGIGSSARFEMSAVLMHKIIHEKKELADVMDELTGKTDLRSTLGAMGVLTDGLLGRSAAYVHGVLFAFAPFLSDNKFWQPS